jgi:hypothetical protein
MSTAGTVTEIRASDGVVLRTVGVGSRPVGVAFAGSSIRTANNFASAFDGTYIPVTNSYGGGPRTVMKLRASDGSVLGTFNVGNSPGDIAFDGGDIWVINGESNTVSKL